MSNPKKNSDLSPSLNESLGAVPCYDTENRLRVGLFRMKENAFYFQHDNTSHTDEKIIDLRSELGFEGYGIFWALLELLHQNDGKLQMNSKRLAFALQVDEKKIINVINDYDLFIIEDGYFYSKRLLEQIEYRAEIIEKRREAGAKGGKSKANAKQMLSKNLPKERKGKERKGNNNYNPFGLVRDEKYILNTLGWEKDIETYHGIQKKYPKLFMMTSPLTFDQHEALVKVWGAEQVKDIYSEMQNYTRLFLSNEEAAKTANNWIKRNKKKEALK